MIGLAGVGLGSAVVGFLCAAFLSAERWAQYAHRGHAWLLYGLPLIGVAVLWLYRTVGESSAGGNRLLMAQLQTGRIRIPLLMGPLILFSTVATHFFGGPVGREGAAVQMGGGLCGGMATALRVGAITRRIWLLAGMSAGFAGIFGTPVGGAFFTLEILGYSRLLSWELPVSIAAGFVGDRACHFAADYLPGAHHAMYNVDLAAAFAFRPGESRPWQVLTILLVVVAAGAGVGWVVRGFLLVNQAVRHTLNQHFTRWWLRPVIAAAAVILLSLVSGPDYLGLGATSSDPQDITVTSSFSLASRVAHGEWYAFAWKALLTAIILGGGFKGGEVTPLFFMGATFGCAVAAGLSRMGLAVGSHVDVLAGAGMIAALAGAAKAPVACAIMGCEMFGPFGGGTGASGNPGLWVLGVGIWFIACLAARFTSGRHGIYTH